MAARLLLRLPLPVHVLHVGVKDVPLRRCASVLHRGRRLRHCPPLQGNGEAGGGQSATRGANRLVGQAPLWQARPRPRRVLWRARGLRLATSRCG